MNEVIQIAAVFGIITGAISAVAGVVFLFDRFNKSETGDHFYHAIVEVSRWHVSRLVAKWIFRSFLVTVAVLATVYFVNIGIPSSMPKVLAPQATTVGDSLPTQRATPLPTSTPTPQATSTPVPMQSYTTLYTVRAGDTLSGIANQFNVTVRDIIAVNSNDSGNVYIGQKLLIPSYLGELSENRKPPTIPSTGTVNVDALNVRATPSTTGTVQNVELFGTPLTLTGVNIIVNGIEWLELAGGNWVQAKYLDIIVKATVIPINGIGVLSDIKRIQVAYIAPHASVLELFRPSPVIDINTWWQVIDGNWVQGRYLDFS